MRGPGVSVAIVFLFLTVALGDEVEVPAISEIVREHFAEGAKGGLALLVVRDKTVIHSKGYGLKNGETPVTSQTRMSLASVAKQFVAMCAAILIDEGKLSLTDKVSKHLPDIQLPFEGRELLVQDLLWHINGLPNFIKAKEKASIAEYKKKHGLTRLNNATHADWLATMPLRRAPGTRYEYTNSGYVLLARIIEVVSGQSYREFQQERILDVLDMTNTRSFTPFNGSANMETTLEDYTKWDRALSDQTLLGTETSKLLFQSGTLDNGQSVGYGFGWNLVHDDQGLSEVWHGGSGSPKGNARNMVVRDIRNQFTVALFVRENLKFNLAARKKFAYQVCNFVRHHLD